MREVEKSLAQVQYEREQAAAAKVQRSRDRDAAWQKEIMTMAAATVANVKAQDAADAAAAKVQKETDFKQSVLESFIDAGGEENKFFLEWPTLRAEIVRQRTLASFAQKSQAQDKVAATLETLYKDNTQDAPTE